MRTTKAYTNRLTLDAVLISSIKYQDEEDNFRTLKQLKPDG